MEMLLIIWKCMSSRHSEDGAEIQLELFSRMFGFILKIYHRGENGYVYYSTVDYTSESSTKHEACLVHADNHFSLLLTTPIRAVIENQTEMEFQDYSLGEMIAAVMDTPSIFYLSLSSILQYLHMNI